MRTLGVDLASAPRDTARASISWVADRAVVEDLTLGCDDDDLVAAAACADVVGVDAPLGWPDAFVAAVAAWHEGRAWPRHDPRHLRLRATDRHVHAEVGRVPLSVSTDRIGVVAFRAVGLLDRIGGPGASRVHGPLREVYPAGCLLRWGLPARGYKRRPEAAAARRVILDGLRAAAPWLDLGDTAAALVDSEDGLDALVTALGARAAALGRCDPPSPALGARAVREAWIHLPAPGSLAGLADQ